MQRNPSRFVKCQDGHTYLRQEWLRRLHRASGLTEEEVGKRLGVTAARVTQVLRGEIRNPKPETLVRFAEVYGSGIWAAWGVGDGKPVEAVPSAPCQNCGRPIPDQADLRTVGCSDYCRRVLTARRWQNWYRKQARQADRVMVG